MLPDSDRAKAEPFCADRIGFAQLTAMAFNGIDLRPLRDELIAKVVGGTAGPGEGLDLSLIAQLLGEKETGLSGGSARLPSIVSLAMRDQAAEIARTRACGRNRHGRQHADRVLAGRIRHRAEDALRYSGYRNAPAAAGS
jgi:hypothetical protein